MANIDDTTRPATPRHEVYEDYAEIETAEAYAAWNEGDHHRASKLFVSAKRWSQFATKAAQGGASQ